MSPLSLLISPRSVTKQTKILDVAQVNVRAEAAGYKPFVGRVRAMSVQPGQFVITLDDVWLAPTSSPLASFTPERLRHEVIESFTVEPAVAAPGEKVSIRFVALLPVDRGFKYRAYLTSTSIRVVENQLELKREKPAKGAPESNHIIFTRTVTVPKNSVDSSTELSFLLVRNEETVLRQRETTALLQVARTAEERAAAEKIAAAYGEARRGNREAALRGYAAVRREQPNYALAHLLYGDLCMQLSRPSEAVDAFKRLVALDPGDYTTARPRHARALVETGRSEAALTELEDAEKSLGKQRLPAEIALVRARVYAERSKFDETDQWLAKAGEGLRIPQEVLDEINLKRMAAAVREKPDDSDLRLGYARVLEATGQRDRAIEETRRAAKLEPSQPWAYVDLGERLCAAGRLNEGISNLKHALILDPKNVEGMLALGDAYRNTERYAEARALYARVQAAQPLNLQARHHLALMQYATGDLKEARESLLAVVNQARQKGELKDDGLPLPGPGILGSGLYLGPKKRLVAGFTIPEAGADLAILEALQDLDRHPESGLLWQNIGNALLELDLPRLALDALRKAQQREPELSETRFLMGVAYRKLGDARAAREELNAAVARNPLHPRARLELAQLFTELGDLDRAQAEVAAHTRNYPLQRPAEPRRALGG
jgi:tetratricopeptide (TPR) repeat protein